MENGVNPLLLDVRTKVDYETSPLKLPGAIRLEPEDVEAGRIKLDVEPKQLMVAYCTTPDEQTSARVAAQLRQRGYGNVRILKGGLGGWTNARLPVEGKSALPSIGLEIYKNLTLGDIERRRFKAGEVIFNENDDAQGEAYVVHAGTVEIRRRLDGHDKILNVLGEGELFGQIGLFLRSSARSAGAVAQSDVELLVIKRERLDWLIRNRPQLTIEVLRQLSELVVTTDAERAERSGRSVR
jgi:rhodanese-related sulfurtransferase